ncbi:hypothetical protein EDB84DRAFT_1509961 [Lactarius hengduanensis]|nr:hypothetical protein EDB84DRAFT_1509961 [Lactarius hengduanensis]
MLTRRCWASNSLALMVHEAIALTAVHLWIPHFLQPRRYITQKIRSMISASPLPRRMNFSTPTLSYPTRALRLVSYLFIWT